MALRLRLAEEFYVTGWYTRAIATLQELWSERGSPAEPSAALLKAKAGIALAELYARLGRQEDLELLMPALQSSEVMVEDLETLRGIRQGLETKRTRPDLAFRCGALALERIRVFQNSTNAGHPALVHSRSSPQGMSLAEIALLSREIGMNYQMACRSPGAPLLTPAVMHLRVGHYVSLLRKVRGQLQIEDPTGWQLTIASSAAVEAEASGYFLVPPGALPPGWRRVDPVEGATIFGRNGTLENDPDATTKRDEKAKCGGSSHGMATWDVHLMLVSQQVVDTPVGYRPPFGPPIDITFRHTQRANQRFGYKPSWTHNWAAQIYENPRALLGDLWFQEEGGWERLSALDDAAQSYQGRIFNDGRVTRPDARTLVKSLPDGSKQTYSTFSDTNVYWGRIFYLSALEDPAGNRVTIQLNAGGRVESVTDPLGRVTRFYYELTDPGLPADQGSSVLPNFDYSNLVTRVVDPFGRAAFLAYRKVERSVMTYCSTPDGYNPCPLYYYNYDLTNITDVAGLSSQFAYDATGTLISELTTPYGVTRFSWSGDSGGAMNITDPQGETERFAFDWFGHAVDDPLWKRPQGMRTDGAGYEVRYWNKNAFAESSRTDAIEGATVYVFQNSDTWSSAGRGLMGVKRPLENILWYNYANQGAAASPGVGLQPTRLGRALDDGSTQLWQMDRDLWGNLTRAVDPIGRTTRYVYAPNYVDLLETWQSVEGGEELLSRFTWSAQHLPLTVLDAAGQLTRYAYNPRGQLTSVTNPRNEITAFTYDTNGFLTAVDGPLAGAQDRTTFTYDAVGRPRTLTDGDGFAVTIDYDALDRITKTTFPDGTFETRSYDRLELGSVQDRMGQVLKFNYDGLRRVVAAQDALGRITRFQWCGCGDISALIDPLGRMTRWQRDLQGRVIAKEYADGSKVAYEFEPGTSRVRRHRDELGQVTEFTYNLANDLVAKRHINASRPTPDVFFTYDAHYARIASMTDGNGITTYRHYPVNGKAGAGQLASINGPWANDEIAFSYDELGRMVQRSIQGIGVSWTFDEAGRLTQLTNVLGSFNHSWDGGSRRLSSVTYPNNQRSDFSYFDNAGDRLLQRITHSLAAGAKLSEFVYAYDPLGRITQWSQLQAGRTKTWALAYDPVDRLTNLVESLPSTPLKSISWAYDAADNRLSEIVNGARSDFTFNALNQIADFSPAVPARDGTYEWDAENRLVAINKGTRRVEFSYDGLDRRTRIVEREGANVLSDRCYLWCGLQVCEERDATGSAVLKRYSYYGAQNLAAPESAPGSYFFTRDHLGSIREAVSTAATAFDYSAYGEQQTLTGAFPSDFGFTGHFQNRTTATLLAPFRAYAPGLARWLNRDPRGELGGFNLYAYLQGDPVNKVDPFGLDWSWQSVKDWTSQHSETIKDVAKNIFHKTKVGEEVKKFEDFDEKSQKILNTELEVEQAVKDPDCGHSGAKLLKALLDWLPSSVQLGPINSAELAKKTLEEGVKNEDAYFDRLNRTVAESERDARN